NPVGRCVKRQSRSPLKSHGAGVDGMSGVAEVSPKYLADVSMNSVPVGYKQTEVGVIPEDWDVLRVGEAFEICNNLRFPLSAKVREGMTGVYPYYGPTKIQG